MRLRLLKNAVEYALFLPVNFAARRLSFRGAGRLGSMLGAAGYSLLRYRRSVSHDNLRRAFPGESPEALRRIARGAYRGYGRALLEMLWSGGASADELRATMTLENPEVPLNALSRGKGLILLSGHFGAWEFIVTSMSLRLGHPVTAIAQPQRNTFIDAVIRANRHRFGSSTVTMHQSVREVLRLLREGRIVGMLGDQSGPRESVFIDFFGRPAATHRGAAAFSLKSGAPIVMFYFLRQADGTYRALFEEVDRSGLDASSEENIVELTRRHTALLERTIRRHPDHWLWMHKRWKHSPPRTILVFHTAFAGDVILTLPLLQVLKESLPDSAITVLTAPPAQELVAGHPAVTDTIAYDKRGRQRGIRGIVAMASQLRRRKFDCALIPHRSLRSALVCRLAGIPVRIGFDASAGSALLTERVRYERTDHEIVRNLALAAPLGIAGKGRPLPRLYPTGEDRRIVDGILPQVHRGNGDSRRNARVGVAPGSLWNTKRWPEERYRELVRLLAAEGLAVVLIGSEADAPLCGRIAAAGGASVIDASGRLSLLQSAELIARCAVLVSNDSAPMHLAVAVGTPVVAIFGATAPAYGFAPAGVRDRIVETTGLRCRPCAIHGGDRCPIGTFVCMLNIPAFRVQEEVAAMLREPGAAGQGK
jgi:heptosyltransferase-2